MGKKKRIQRAKTWYSGLDVLHKVQFIGLVLVGLFIIAEIVVFGVVWVQSLQEGLSIYVHADDEIITLPQGQSLDVSFRLAMQNAPFCEATCNWSVVDHSKGQRLAEGTMTDQKGEKDITVRYQAPLIGRTTAPLQLTVMCANVENLRCQRASDTAAAASTTTITVVYSDEKEVYARDAHATAAGFIATQERAIGLLRAVQQVRDVRTTTIRNIASIEETELTTAVDLSRTLIAHEEFEDALALMGQTQFPTTPDTYQTLLTDERFAAQALTRLYQAKERLVAAASLASLPYSRALATNVSYTTQLAGTFQSIQPALMRTAIRDVEDALETAEQNASWSISEANSYLDAVQQDKTALCTLYGVSCSSVVHVTTVEDAFSGLQTSCAWTQGVQGNVSSAQAYFAEHVQANTTFAALQTQYNASDLWTGNWSMRENQIVALARQGFVNATLQEILAVNFTSAASSYATVCPVQQTTLNTLSSVPGPTLPDLTAQTVSIDPLIFPEPMCCSQGNCQACVDSPYPVVFVHGHSFSKHSTPEYNLQAFADMALYMQSEGRLFVGNVFPQQPATIANLAQIPGGISVTTTYYYDSFAEQGELQLIPQKSERIETYAIRLQEAIDETKARTDSEKVILVAHSMGGLVARRNLQLFGAHDVAGLVMIGTPNAGISRLTDRLCPIIGADFECQDMQEGSVFLNKLNAEDLPDIPLLIVAGTGCDGRGFDGVVETESVLIDGVTHIIVQGECPNNDNLLHSTMLDPKMHPEVYTAVRDFVASVADTH